MKQIVLDITPIPAPRLNANSRFNPKKKPIFDRYMQWKQDIQILALAAGWKPTDEIRVVFVVPMPKSWPKKKRLDMDGQPHQQTPDRNNLTKALEDALYHNDSRVWKSSEEKRWGARGQIIILQ